MRLTEKNTPLLSALRKDTIDNPAMFIPLRNDIFEEPLDLSVLDGIPEPFRTVKAHMMMEKTAGYRAYKHILDNWAAIRKDISHVQMISEPFYENMTLCAEKLWPLLGELDGKTLSGTLIVSSNVCFCYHLEMIEAAAFDYTGYFFIVNKESLIAAYFIDESGMADVEFLSIPTVIGDPIKSRNSASAAMLEPKGLRPMNSEEKQEMIEQLRMEDEQTRAKLMGTILIYELFRRYANIQTVFSLPNKKVSLPGSGDTLLVDSNTRVEYVDCTWFTTIVRSEGFRVRGHFRLQPYPKEGVKRLIYIDEFQKHGYTRKAKKLLYDNNEANDEQQ